MGNVAETYWQAGIETTRGTAVAATRKIYEEAPIPEEQRNKEYVKQARQSFIENYEAVETHALAEWSVEGVLSYADAAWWSELMLKGGVSPTGVGPYTRVYNGTGTSDDLKAATFEVAHNVGAFQLPYGMCDAWDISGKGGVGKAGLVAMKLKLLAQKLTPGHTMTGSLSERDLRGTYAAFQHVQFYLNDTAGVIGTTEIGTLMEFSIKGKNNIKPIFFGGDTGYFGSHGREKRFVDFMVKLKFDSTSYSEFQNKFRNNTGRYGQLKFTGPSSQTLTWNFYTKFDKFDWPEDGPTRQVSLLGRSIYDSTLGYDWQATLVNNVAAI